MFAGIFCLFFFKQKTAYEMRISDWSSDVCSSDLPRLIVVATLRLLQLQVREITVGVTREERVRERSTVELEERGDVEDFKIVEHNVLTSVDDRSEEHTSELQSLMRISYAVFCLKNKK